MRYHQDSCAKWLVFGVCRFNCVSEICVRPTPVATVTKILKFLHKNYNNSVPTYKIGPRILHQTGGFRGWPINRSHSIFARPTLVAMVTKIGKFYQKSA